MKEALQVAISINQAFLNGLKPYTNINRGLSTRLLRMTKLTYQELTALNQCLEAKSPDIFAAQRHYQKFINAVNSLQESEMISTDIIKFADNLAAHINLFRLLDPQCATKSYMLELIAYYLQILEKQNIVRNNTSALQGIMPSQVTSSTAKTSIDSSKTILLQAGIEKKPSDHIEPMDPAMPIDLYINSLLSTHDMTAILAIVKQLIEKISVKSDKESILTSTPLRNV